jgi:hypothetical protein
MQMTSAANRLYKDLWDSNENLREHHNEQLDPGEARLVTYNALKAVTGLGDAITTESQQKRATGLLSQLFGRSAHPSSACSSVVSWLIR